MGYTLKTFPLQENETIVLTLISQKEGFHRKKILQIIPETVFYMQIELHFYSTVFKTFIRKNMLWEVSLTEHNSHALELFYF